jgi:hypothetical protein
MLKKKSSDERHDYIYRAALRVVTVDGEEVDIAEAQHLVKSLRGKDALAFRQAVERVNFGIDPEVEAPCQYCGYPNDLILPMDKSFFRPERSVI